MTKSLKHHASSMLGVSIALLTCALGCEENPRRTIIDPFSVAGEGCVGGGAGNCMPSSAIEIVGGFNAWPAPGDGPHAKSSGQCVWAAELEVAEGTHLMKLRTNDAWDGDWGTCTSEDDTQAFAADSVCAAVCLGSGEGTALGVAFPSTATYRFELDEGSEMLLITRVP